MKLALGTAQFGLDYGVANTAGQVSVAEAGRILRHAKLAGLDTLDTAIGYGVSEQRLGAVGVSGWKVVSKLPAIPTECEDVAAWVDSEVKLSLSRLGLASMYGLLLHRPLQLLEPVGRPLLAALRHLKADGHVKKIGVSVYGPDELDALWTTWHFDLVQAPFNVLDRRLETSGWLERLESESVEIHVRSVFLQGLLVSDSEHVMARFAQWKTIFEAWKRWLADTGQTPVDAALSHALSFPAIARVIVGVDSTAQLAEILRSTIKEARTAPIALSTEDVHLLNPALWPTSG